MIFLSRLEPCPLHDIICPFDGDSKLILRIYEDWSYCTYFKGFKISSQLAWKNVHNSYGCRILLLRLLSEYYQVSLRFKKSPHNGHNKFLFLFKSVCKEIQTGGLRWSGRPALPAEVARHWPLFDGKLKFFPQSSLGCVII